MNNDALQKAKRFADSAYAAAADDIAREFLEKFTEIRARFSASGEVRSGAMTKMAARLHAERISRLLLAHVDSTLEGYEMCYVSISDEMVNSLVANIMQKKEQVLAHTAESAHPLDSGPVGRELFAELVKQHCEISAALVKVRIERRRRMSYKKETTVTNIYHVHGHNPRWNVNSEDNSVNVVSASNDQIFNELQ